MKSLSLNFSNDLTSFDKKRILGWMQPINPKYDEYCHEIFNNIVPDIKTDIEEDLFSNETSYQNNKEKYLCHRNLHISLTRYMKNGWMYDEALLSLYVSMYRNHTKHFVHDIDFNEEKQYHEEYTTKDFMSCKKFINLIQNNKRVMHRQIWLLYILLEHNCHPDYRAMMAVDFEDVSIFVASRYLTVMNKKLILAFTYLDRYMYDIFFKDKEYLLTNFMDYNDFIDLKYCCKSFIYRLQYFVGFDTYIYHHRMKIIKDDDIFDSDFQCICPMHVNFGNNWYSTYASNRIVPKYMCVNVNDKSDKNFRIGKCDYEYHLSIAEFKTHIRDKIVKEACFDHLALHCYLLAVHGHYFNIKLEVNEYLRAKMKEKMMESIIDYNDQKQSNIEQTLELRKKYEKIVKTTITINTTERVTNFYPRNNHNSPRSDTSSSTQFSTTSSFSSSSCTQVFADYDICNNQLLYQIRQLKVYEQSKIKKYFEAIFKYKKYNGAKETKILIELKGSILVSCKKFIDNFELNTHRDYKYLARFLENLDKNHVWDIGLIHKKCITDSTNISKLKLCMCPCSQYMKYWQRTYITNRSKWNCSFKNLPCKIGLMTNKEFLAHVEELQNVDIYHHYLYKYIKKKYPEYT